jgi:hypothetical protein
VPAGRSFGWPIRECCSCDFWSPVTAWSPSIEKRPWIRQCSGEMVAPWYNHWLIRRRDWASVAP